jgi:hypothetical protein
MKKKISLVISGLIVIFISWFIWEIVTDRPPIFFPLNNPQGEYKITKGCPMEQGWNEQIMNPSNEYCVEYKGPDVFMNSEYGNTNFFRITVGKSNINLKEFEGKKVKNIQGQYVSSDKQCIQNKCVDIGGPLVVLDIDKLEMAD